MALSKEQITEFKEVGFIVAQIFEGEDFEPLKEEVSAFVDEHAQRAFKGGKITQLHEDKGFYQRMAYIMKEHPEIADSFNIKFLRGREMCAPASNTSMCGKVARQFCTML